MAVSKYAPEVHRGKGIDYKARYANSWSACYMYSMHGEHMLAAKLFAEADIYESLNRDRQFQGPFTLNFWMRKCGLVKR